jgi:hypothetical protein
MPVGGAFGWIWGTNQDAPGGNPTAHWAIRSALEAVLSGVREVAVIGAFN